MSWKMVTAVLVLAAVAVLPVRMVSAEDERLSAIEKRLQQLEKENTQLKSQMTAKTQSIETKVNTVYQRAMGSGAPCPYLCADKPDICGFGLYFTGEYMYSKFQKGETTFAYRNAVNSSNFIGGTFGDQLGQAQNTELDWSHGFRLGLGYRLPYDGWEVGVTYQRVDTDSDSTVRADTTGGQQYLYTPFFQTRAAIARAEQDQELGVLNIELGRKSKFSEQVSFRIFAGPSLVWLEDRDKFQYWGDANVPATPFAAFDGINQGGYYKRSSDTFLYGIRAGADGELKFGGCNSLGLSLYGKGAVSLLTGEQENKTFQANDAAGAGSGSFASTEIFQDVTSRSHQIVPVFELEAGVAWNHKLLDNLNLKVSAGYQFQEYLNVIERTSTNASQIGVITPVISQRSDLGLHGLVFKVRLDF